MSTQRQRADKGQDSEKAVGNGYDGVNNGIRRRRQGSRLTQRNLTAVDSDFFTYTVKLPLAPGGVLPGVPTFLQTPGGDPSLRKKNPS